MDAFPNYHAFTGMPFLPIGQGTRTYCMAALCGLPPNYCANDNARDIVDYVCASPNMDPFVSFCGRSLYCATVQ
jgi:hypothetical protein